MAGITDWTSESTELPFWERPEIVERFSNRALDHRVARWIETIEQPSSVHVLDVGCGGGRNAGPLVERGFDVFALDASRGMVERTRELVAEVLGADEAARRVVHGRMDDLSAYADSFADLVLLIGVLHSSRSTAEWHRAVTEAVRVLKPDGQVLTACFAPGTDATGEGVERVEGEPHMYIGPSGLPTVQLTPEETDAWIAEHGLVPVEPTYQVSRDRPVGEWYVVNGWFRRAD